MSNPAAFSSPVLLRLKAHADEKRSGELIVASGDLEIHVFLQEGRIAWATSAASRLAFTRHLVEEVGIDSEAMREVVSACQQSRRPIGETLVAWKLATPEDVRQALRAQIVAALSEMAALGQMQVIFLDRGDAFREYERDLTFEYDNVVADLELGAVARAAPVPTQELDVEALLRHLVESREGEVVWAAVARGTEIQAAHSAATVIPTVATLQRVSPLVAAGQTTLAVVMNDAGGLAGVPLPEQEALLWCALTPEASLSAVVRELETAAHLAVPPSDAPDQEAEPWQAIINPEFTLSSAALKQAMDQTPELRWASLCRRSGRDPSLLRRRSESFEPTLSLSDELGAVAQALPAQIVDGLATPAAVASPGVTRMWLRIGDRLHSAAAGPERGGFCLWLVFDSRTSIGFGSALLTSLARRVGATLGREAWTSDDASCTLDDGEPFVP